MLFITEAKGRSSMLYVIFMDMSLSPFMTRTGFTYQQYKIVALFNPDFFYDYDSSETQSQTSMYLKKSIID